MFGGHISKIVISLDPNQGFCEATHQKKSRIVRHQLIYDTWQNYSFYKNGKFIIDFSTYILNTDISFSIRPTLINFSIHIENILV